MSADCMLCEGVGTVASQPSLTGLAECPDCHGYGIVWGEIRERQEHEYDAHRLRRENARLRSRLARVLELRGTGRRPPWPGVWSGRAARGAKR